MHFACPHCGPRPVEEFEFRSLAPLEQVSGFVQVYGRENSQSQSVEHWQHVHGCRAWLVIERNPTSAEVLAVRWLGAAP